MTDDKSPHRCQCCGPTEFEFPEELMTPELQKMRQKMGKKAFLEHMKSLIG